MDEKNIPYIHAVADHSSQTSDENVTANNGTRFDVDDMARMGKKQQFKRNWRTVSIISFIAIMQSSWESTLLVGQFGLYNGGTAGVIWCTIAVWLGVVAMIVSMGEMASIAPTAGGQYHWISEFAPASVEKPLSYVVGWCCCFSWVSAMPACGQLLSGLVQGMVILAYPEANISALWQTTLMIFFWLFLTFSFNIFLAKYLPMAETIVMGVHAIGFIVFLGVLWGTAEIAPAQQVFTQGSDGGGWGSLTLSTLVGMTTPLWCFLGPDAAAHMSEELTDASLSLPRAMLWATLANGFMGISMIITFCFCAGNISEVLDSQTGVPIIQVLYNNTQSMAATCVMGTLLVILTYFSAVSVIAASSRQCWAFARDRGFPYSNWIVKVKTVCGIVIPLNSILVCLAVSLILATINFGSDVALNAIISVSNAALLFSYIISLGCFRLLRWKGNSHLPRRRWDLGKFGAPLNDLALVFLIVSFVFSFFPITPMVDDSSFAADFNWAIVMFAALCLLALGYYCWTGKTAYISPVRLVKRE